MSDFAGESVGKVAVFPLLLPPTLGILGVLIVGFLIFGNCADVVGANAKHKKRVKRE